MLYTAAYEFQLPNSLIYQPIPPLQMFQGTNLIIHGGPLLAQEIMYWSGRSLRARSAEESQRIPVRQNAILLHPFVNLELPGHRNLVQARFQLAIRPALQDIRHGDDQIGGILARHGDKRVPLAAILKFEAACVILEQEAQSAEVGMWPDASRVLSEKLALGDAGIVIEAQLAYVGEGVRE